MPISSCLSLLDASVVSSVTHFLSHTFASYLSCPHLAENVHLIPLWTLKIIKSWWWFVLPFYETHFCKREEYTQLNHTNTLLVNVWCTFEWHRSKTTLIGCEVITCCVWCFTICINPSIITIILIIFSSSRSILFLHLFFIASMSWICLFWYSASPVMYYIISHHTMWYNFITSFHVSLYWRTYMFSKKY